MAEVDSTEVTSLKIKAVIETAIYVDDRQAVETFYGTILGLRVIGNEPGHHIFFQVGEVSTQRPRRHACGLALPSRWTRF